MVGGGGGVKGEQTASAYVPLMTGTEVSPNCGIPASEDNLASSVQADGNGNMSLPWLAISLEIFATWR